MFRENSIETCTLSRVKQITSPVWMHETSAQTWCTGKSQRDRVEREVLGGIGMEKTFKLKAVSFQCMTKFTTIKKNNNNKKKIQLCGSLFVAVQSLSHVQLFTTPWNAVLQTSLSFTISWRLLRLTSTVLMMPSNHLILYLTFLLLPSIFPSIKFFSNVSVHRITWPEYWSFSFSISPSSEYSG